MTDLTDLYIIIAEDDPDDADIVQNSFEKNKLYSRVKVVTNGKELLGFLENNPNDIPDVILTDINMPIMNGMEALKEISENVRLQLIPSFVYSTTANPAYEQRCKDLGIYGFLIKPYTIEEFDMIPSEIISILTAKLSLTNQ